MTSAIAPPKNTGGGGFIFENDVCAWLLACMLAREPPFDVALGAPSRLDFQTRAGGWFLDDVLVRLDDGAQQVRLALSIKSNAQFTATEAPGDFVTSAWEQWLRIGSQVLDPQRDFQGLITGQLSAAARDSVAGLSKLALAADPDTFANNVAEPGFTNADQRALFSSFACPQAVATTTSHADTTRLLQRLRFLQHDFGEVGSDSHKRALALCRKCVRTKSDTDADTLWNTLRALAEELRPVAGHITLLQLIDRLRHRIALADYPTYDADWAALASRAKREAEQITDTIAGSLRLPRDQDIDSLASGVAERELVALLGPSGAGKSAVARLLFERRAASDERTLWVDARSLDCTDIGMYESTLHLQHPLDALLRSDVSLHPVLILDGMDRFYSSNVFRNAAALLHFARQTAPSARWRIVLPCQSPEWPRVQEALHREGFAAEAWHSVSIASPSVAQLTTACDSIPALKRLILLPRVGALLTNLKLLDRVARRVASGTQIDASVLVGESSIAEWFWSAEIDRGDDRVLRGRFVRELAQRQADQLIASISTDDFEISELGPMATLASDRLCAEASGRISFEHDLYGDWVRVRILLNQTDLVAFLRPRAESPLWHRALRLVAIHRLEQADGIAQWRSLHSDLGQAGLGVLQDVVLEGPAFSVNAEKLLNAALPDLLANDGVLLRRLITRFLAFATVPDPRILAIATVLGEADIARTRYRTPYWPYWPGFISFLHAHRHQVVANAPNEVARIVEQWLGFSERGWSGRDKIAELAVLLGQRALDNRGGFGGKEWQAERVRIYRCVLEVSHEQPDEVVRIALAASARTDTAEDGAENDAVASSRFCQPLPPPWPEGPRARVDDAFQTVVLEGNSIQKLFDQNPAVAREIVLACLIEEPTRMERHERWERRRELGIAHRFGLPPMYTRGPFLGFLNSNFDEGLELVLSLVTFAATRMAEGLLEDAKLRRVEETSAGSTEQEAEQIFESIAYPRATLHLANGTKTFFGNEDIYNWYAGSAPQPVASALMALEQYLYLQLDEGKNIDREIEFVFARSENVALLGVLCEISKRHRSLFTGFLLPLLSSPEIYSWDIRHQVHGRDHLLIGVPNKGFVALARAFHEQSHRKADLRDIATRLMLDHDELHGYFERVRSAWTSADARHDVSPDLMQQLLRRLDPSNYEFHERGEHGSYWVNVAELKHQEVHADERRVVQEDMALRVFPMTCRKVLEEGKRLQDAQLIGLWNDWKQIQRLAAERPVLVHHEFSSGDEYANAITAGVAVLLWHREWCESNPERISALLSALRDVLENPPKPHFLDSDDTIMTSTWQCFAADAFSLLWCRDPSNAEWRLGIANAVFAKQYAAVEILFARCAEHRAVLDDDFSRLRRLALEWSYIRDRRTFLKHSFRSGALTADAVGRFERDLMASCEEKRNAFVAGVSETMPTDWSSCDDRSRFVDLDSHRLHWNRYQRLDLRVLRRSHTWLPMPDQALDQDDRREIVAFLHGLLAVVIARPLGQHEREHGLHPHEDEWWALQLVGTALLQLRPDEQPERLWQPVFDLAGEAHAWPEALMNAMHRYALNAPQVPAAYASTVEDMCRYAFGDVGGRRRWKYYERIWDALVGVDSYSQPHWAPRHTVLVQALAATIVRWMDTVELDGGRLGTFASWLALPAASPIRFTALVWMLKVVREEPPRIGNIEEAEEAIAALLGVAWSTDDLRLRSDPSAFAAFRGLLTWLSERQHPAALELLGRIGLLA